MSNAGTQVFLIRIKGDAVPDFRDAVAAEEFAATISNASVSAPGSPLAFADVPRHIKGNIDTLFTPAGFGDPWQHGIIGGAGKDAIFGRLDDDTMHGGGGNDSIGGHWGYNVLFGVTATTRSVAVRGPIIPEA